MMKKGLSFVLSVFILLSLFPIVFAAEVNNNNQAEAPVIDQNRVAEITELRSCNSETFLLSDGNRECVLYSENKYYQDEQGEYRTVDNEIVSAEFEHKGVTYKYANAANSTRAYFSEISPSVLIMAKGYDLAFSLSGADVSDVKAGGMCPEYHFPGYDLLGLNQIAYLGVCPDADLVYSVNNGGIKEYIVLNSNNAPQEYSFRFDTTAYTIRQNEDGTVGVFNSVGKLCFELGKLFAIDSAGVYTDSVNYEIIEEKGETTTVKVVVDRDYLEHPDRTYPVLIDPSIMITGEWDTYDTYVASRYPTTNYYLQHYFRTGRDEDFYTRRTFIKFDLPSGITSNSISSAYIDVKYYSGSTSGVKAYRVTGNWASSTLTWNNMPNFTTTNASPAMTYYSDNWYRMYVTNIVKGWYSGANSNYGFMLKDDTESGTSHWSTFYSSDAPSPNKPELHIIYQAYTNMDAQLIGVSNENHDHTSCLTDSRPYLLGCDLGNVYIHDGAFSVATIQNYLDNNTNSVFISRSHGGYDPSGTTTAGTYILLNDDATQVKFKSSTNMSALNLSNMRLVMFIGCYTGYGGNGGANLPTVAVNKGATTAIGFQESINCAKANTWTVQFCNYMNQEVPVNAACSSLALLSQYADTGLESYVICGNLYTKLK